MSDRWQTVAGDLFQRVSELEVIKIKSDARIAELAAELHNYKLNAQHALDVLGHRVHELEVERDKWQWLAHLRGDSALERATKAEAERDRLKAALHEIAIAADIGLNIGPVIRMAKAALAPAEGEGR